MLYAFEWGKEKSESWLANIIISTLETVILVQPVKVCNLLKQRRAFLKIPDILGEFDKLLSKGVDSSVSKNHRLHNLEGPCLIPVAGTKKNYLQLIFT